MATESHIRLSFGLDTVELGLVAVSWEFRELTGWCHPRRFETSSGHPSSIGHNIKGIVCVELIIEPSMCANP